jgi:hypothetical protein
MENEGKNKSVWMTQDKNRNRKLGRKRITKELA